MDWVPVYDFASDTFRIAAMQRATLATGGQGLAPEPALVGSQKLSQAQVAKRAQVDQGDVSKIERGMANPTLATLSAVALAVGLGGRSSATALTLRRWASGTPSRPVAPWGIRSKLG
jgi:DNA-binding phage protein